MTNYLQPASDSSIRKATQALKTNNIDVLVVDSAEKAREQVLELIPEGSEVMTATSTTLDQIGVTEVLNNSGKYNSVKSQLKKLDRKKDHLLMQKLGAAPEYVIGSVHAVTEDGKVIIASGSGSQLPAYTYGATHVIWVVSTKKLVQDLGTALKRLYDYVLPLEDARIKKLYGPDAASHVRKLFILNSELTQNRITLIFVREDLGF